MNPLEYLSSLLGPAGAFVLALVGCVVFWRDRNRLEQARQTEHEARLADAKATSASLLDLYREVSRAIGRLEHLAEMMTGPNRPAPRLSDSTSDAAMLQASARGPAE
jgi:hypothetical protein